MKRTEIRIRLALFTEYGPAGHRLQKATPLPIKDFTFPDTPEGRKEAEEAREKLQGYCDKNAK